MVSFFLKALVLLVVEIGYPWELLSLLLKCWLSINLISLVSAYHTLILMKLEISTNCNRPCRITNVWWGFYPSNVPQKEWFGACDKHSTRHSCVVFSDKAVAAYPNLFPWIKKYTLRWCSERATRGVASVIASATTTSRLGRYFLFALLFILGS